MARPLNFRQIEAFRAVMHTGSTTAAAVLLHTTQPSISRLLAQARQATELKLFDIRGGRLRPTSEAHALYDAVQHQFRALERIEQTVVALRTRGAGAIRVGCTPALGISLVPGAVAAFRAARPGVRVNVQTTGAHALRDGLLRGEHDVILSTTPVDDAHLDARTLHSADAVCVLHRRHRLAGRPGVHVRDLANEDLVTLNADDEIQVQVRRLFEAHGLACKPAVETTFSFTICVMVAEGAGVGIVNPYVASVFARDLRVVALAPRCPVSIVLAYPQHRSPSRLTEELVRCVEARLRQWKRG